MSQPSVSVIVVSWNGLQHLEHCLGSILASDYPSDRLQVILVDNGSTDGTAAFVSARFPAVTLLTLPRNEGFTGGNAAGVRAAGGDILVFFNNDMRIARGAISALVSALDEGVECAAARVLSWDGRRVDFVRGTVSFEGLGFQEHYGASADGVGPMHGHTFFPNGGAFAVTRQAYERAGGFDARYFAYYDDVDLGWRLRLHGVRVRLAADAVVYHRHGATSRKHPSAQKRFLMDRNALWTLMKNYGDEARDRALPAALLLAVRRIVQETQINRRSGFARRLAPFSSRCRSALAAPSVEAADIYADRDDAGEESSRGEAIVRRLPLERLAALGAALGEPEQLAACRAAVQTSRVVADADILPAMGRGLARASNIPSYRDAHDTVVERLGLPALLRGRSRVLIVTHEPLGEHFSGPGVRALEMGRALARDADVTIASPCQAGFRDDRCTIVRHTPGDSRALRALASNADVILVQGFTLSVHPFLFELGIPIVADLYCPFTIEHLEMQRARTARGREPGEVLPVSPQLRSEAAQNLTVQAEQLRRADFFICASERQRDFWLGMLHGTGRINPWTYGHDPTLRRLIDVVPFGLPDQAPRTERRALKGVRPGIARTDHVLLWAGSILDWQDPETLIRAVARLAQHRQDVKLFFMGTRHPNPQVKPMRAVADSMALARELGVMDTQVFFNDWVPYQERAAFLLDADLGLSTHREHLETHLSFRTRILDYIWSGLPIVCSRGDHFAELVDREDLGAVVEPGDVEELAAAIERLLDDPDRRRRCAEKLRELARDFEWDRVVEPLRRFCTEPALARDRAAHVRRAQHQIERRLRAWRWVVRSATRLGMSETQIEGVKSSWLARRMLAFSHRRIGKSLRGSR